MGQKALIETATGLVINRIEIEPDSDGGYSHFTIPDGCELIDVSHPCEPGGRWDGTIFHRPPRPEVSRIYVLMHSDPFNQNLEDGTSTPKTELELKAESDKLLTLLQAKLADSGDLTSEEMNKMLALERES